MCCAIEELTSLIIMVCEVCVNVCKCVYIQLVVAITRHFTYTLRLVHCVYNVRDKFDAIIMKFSPI